MITDSLLDRQLSVFGKIARLFLISDILHNSSLPILNVWKFRTAYFFLFLSLSFLFFFFLILVSFISFEPKLNTIFEHLNVIFLSISARLRAEQVKV